MKHSTLSLCVMALALGLSGAAWAQGATAQPAQPSTPPAATQSQAPQQPMSSDFSDADVTKFAKANKKVQSIESEYTGKLKAAGSDQEKAMGIQQEAQDKMVKAVKDEGLDVNTYNQIVQVARADPKLAARIQSKQ